MNVKLNKLILELPEVESLFVFPSCGDESNSIGAAWAYYSDYCRQQNLETQVTPLNGNYWGRDFTNEEVDTAIQKYQFHKQIKVTRCEDIEKKCAEVLAQGNVIARYKGRMEFGARALGNRTIMANPSEWKTIHTINAMIKNRDFWMPFAPSMMFEYADDYIVNPKKARAPYMILAFDTKEQQQDTLAAAIHPYDKSCRPQIVEKEINPDYHKLLGHYRELTNRGTILNTSFNLHGFPIVYHPNEALEVFDKSGLTHLAIEDYLIELI